MAGAFDVTSRAVRQSSRDLFGDAKRKRSVLFAVPEPNRYTDVF
jgi:hypothetical protein